MVYGRRETALGPSHMIASESVALSVLDYNLVGDIRPGEALFIDLDGRVHSRVCADDTRHVPCIFEFVYLARPDSFIDDISVYRSRMRMGEETRPTPAPRLA